WWHIYLSTLVPTCWVTYFSKVEATLCLVGSSSKSSEYRPINISVNFYSDHECKIKVSTTNFFPQLKVDAAIVSFKLKKAADYPCVSSTKSFSSMVNCVFNENRKILRKSLHHVCPSPGVEATLCVVNLSPSVSFTFYH
ncbi:ribosomal RNA small subunit methyltransferase A, partial [Striga asiatica]